MYLWNLELCAAFHPLTAMGEVAFRNRVESQLLTIFGARWWDHRELHGLLGSKGKGILLRAAAAVRDRGRTPVSGRVTAELSLGFWVNMLLPKYAARVWPDFDRAFPDKPPGINQGRLHERAALLREFRNRASHHEPIFKRDLTRDHGQLVEFLGWVNAEAAGWLKPELRAMALLRERP